MRWDNNYKINFKKLALLLLPTMLRNNVMGEIAKILVTPLDSVHAQLMSFRRQSDFRLTHNGQRCYLRGCLNDIYDPIDRRIKVDDADKKGEVLIFFRNDDQSRVTLINNGNPLMLNARGFAGGLDFVVKVPDQILKTDGMREKIRATVSEYKLASKMFIIESLN